LLLLSALNINLEIATFRIIIKSVLLARNKSDNLGANLPKKGTGNREQGIGNRE
jgi:hypothetical protein